MKKASSSMVLPTRIKRLILAVAEAEAAFYILPALIILLIAGTIAQRWIGLYAAHKMFFSSFYFWAGPLPLPGGFTLLGLLTLSLTLKFFLKSPWTRAKAGITLIHAGILILLIGGLMTALTARETYMVIREGEENSYTYHYTDKTLDIYENDRLFRQLDFKDFAQWKDADLPFTINPDTSCINCKIIEREVPLESGHGMAAAVELQTLEPALDPEANFSGASIELGGISDQYNGHYLIFDGMPKPIELELNDRTYALIFGKQQFPLPFNFRLDRFTKELYGGTDTARSYESDLTLTQGDLSWPVHIGMNSPYRYSGYTFYQSSFIESPQGTATILSVVENKGRLFPYIGTIVTALGLLLHLYQAIFRRQRNT